MVGPQPVDRPSVERGQAEREGDEEELLVGVVGDGLGRLQAVFLCEFDGPRDRTITVTAI